MRVRELQFYTEKISEKDIENLLEQVLKSSLPLFGFIDIRDIFSYNFLKLIIRRKANTLQFFIEDSPQAKVYENLLFPFRLSEPIEIEEYKKTSFAPDFLITDEEIISFMLKGRIEEIELKFKKLCGRYICTGRAIDEDHKRKGILVTDPVKFLTLDIEKNPSIYIEILEPLPKLYALKSSKPLFEGPGISIGLDNFDPLQHTLVLGGSGTGKSKFLYILIQALQDKFKDSARIVVLDPHGELIKLFPNAKVVDFRNNYIEPLDIAGQKTPLMSQLITQLIISSISGENKYAERVVYYAINLLIETDNLTLENINALLTDNSKRAEFISLSRNDEVKRFFDQEYNDIYIHNFNDAVLPILNFIGEYQLHLGNLKNKESLLDLINKNRLVVISFNPHFFGQTMIKFLSNAVVNQMYILALTENFNRPTFFIVDEAPRVESLTFKDILAETRKFNLYLCISAQYLSQMKKPIVDGIISNVRNIIAFKLNKEDSRLISSIMEIKLEEYFRKSRSLTELEEAKKEMFLRLNVRECIVRLFSQGKYLIPTKVKVVDVKEWGLKDDKLVKSN